MRKIYSSLVMLFLVTGAIAQTPMYFNTNVAGGANIFPLGSSANTRKVQWFIPAGTLGSVGPGNNITKVYFQTGGVSNLTYPIINISLKSSTGTGLTGVAAGPAESGMTLVYSGVNVPVASTVGGWLGFTLQTPWLYNPNQGLIVELEHNSTTAGPTVYQAVSIPGPGNGRQWMDYGSNTITGIGTQQVNFGIDVIPATPCTGAPPTNTLVPNSFTTCPGLNNPNLNFAATYSFGGLTYQWQSSTVSPVGPFTAIPGSTLSYAPTPSISVNTWYQAVVTCTNPGGLTTTISPATFFVAGNVSGTVPYYEGFEGIQMNDRLPNCSWFSPNLGGTVKTYSVPQNSNRVPRNGSRFASFAAPASNSHVYSHPIWMEAGVTYSAGIWYTSDYFGGNNWTDLSLLVGQNQSPTGLTLIASANPAVSGPYKSLGGVYTVPTSGLYHIAVRATGNSGGAPYLSWDDLEVTIPCEGAGAVNAPTLAVSASNYTICENDNVSISVNGADSYSWTTGSTQQFINATPAMTGTFGVWGTNTLTGCTDFESIMIYVNPSPVVNVFTSTNSACAGSPVYLSAIGALSFVWSNGGTGPYLTVNPNSTTTYSVVGTNQYGCTGGDFRTITVIPLPNISASSSHPGACKGDEIILSAAGGQTYTWYNSGNGLVYKANPITIVLQSATNFTVTGTNAQGCSKSTALYQDVQTCTDLRNASVATEAAVFPNPTSGVFTLQFNTKSLRAIEITDVSGRLISTESSEDTEKQLDISKLSSGIYYLTVKENGTSQVLKVVKQ